MVMTYFRSRPACSLVICALATGLFLGTCASAQTPASVLAPEEPFKAEIEQFVRADQVNPPAPCQVLFVGSSSIVMWKTLARDMAPMPVINRGFGGSHIEHVNHWFDSVVAPYRPRAIVFYAGENDLDSGKPVERVITDFDTFMARKTAKLGPTPVYFISLKPSKLRFAQLALQTKVNEAIRARADQRADLHYIEVAASMLQESRPKDIFIEDGLHMNPQGYAIWTQAVRAALLPNADGEARTCAQSVKHSQNRWKDSQPGETAIVRVNPVQPQRSVLKRTDQSWMSLDSHITH